MYGFTKRDLLNISLFSGLILTVIFCCRFSVFAQTAQVLRQDTLRLHIRANSDSDYDQGLKLRVRDAILSQAGQLFCQSADKQEAVESAQRALPQIEAIAQNTLQKEGCFLPVHAYLTRMYFDTTEYTGFTLPAGAYDALRVEIGSGAGHNWFCVLYPGLCLPAAEGESLYPESQQQLVESSPKICFATLEWLQKLKQRLAA